MKFVVTGSTGHISKPLASKLIAAGNEVTIVSSNPERATDIEAMGAKAAIGSVDDVPFLKETFKGADAVYLMVPPKWDAANWKQHIHNIGRNYAEALKESGVKKVVNLSSMGAHMPENCGPVSGLYFAEQELNKLDDIDVKHLRPGFFYYNFFSNIGMIKHMGILGGNYGENNTIVMTHPEDIAEVAAAELLSPAFTGKTVRYIASDEKTTSEIASILGAAIGKPELPWVNFKNEDALGGMLQAGLSHEVASNYVEMGAAMANGEMAADYQNNRPELSSTKLTDFAKDFAFAFSNS